MIEESLSLQSTSDVYPSLSESAGGTSSGHPSASSNPFTVSGSFTHWSSEFGIPSLSSSGGAKTSISKTKGDEIRLIWSSSFFQTSKVIVLVPTLFSVKVATTE